MSGLHLSGITAAPSVAAALQISMDAASITIYVLMAGAVLLVWYGDRRPRRERGNEEDDESRDREEEAAER